MTLTTEINGHTSVPNGTNGVAKSPALIIPPPDLRDIVNKTASWVARKGPQFEERIREKEQGNPKFSFLNPGDAYNAYYRQKVDDIANGCEDDSTPAKQTQAAQKEPQAKKPNIPQEPPPYVFVTPLPPMSAQDLDVIKMTAQFVARNGQRFLDDLIRRESGNYQFDFLKPGHSLNRLFNMLIEQYRHIFYPSDGLREQLLTLTTNRYSILQDIKKRAEYAAYLEAERQKKDDEEEQDRIAFNSIDWHDFVVVQTVEFTEADQEMEYPRPIGLEELQSMSLAQKKKASMFGAESVKDDVEEMEMDATVTEDSQSRVNDTPVMTINDPSVKIRTDYVPRALRQSRKDETRICPICNQPVLVDELNQHMRVELKDPKYKEQRAKYEARISTTNLIEEGQDVASNIRNLARSRTDLFGTDDAVERRRQQDAQERARARERESVVWDGHAATRSLTAARLNKPPTVEEQIEMQRRQHEAAVKAIGPQGMPIQYSQAQPQAGYPQHPYPGYHMYMQPQTMLPTGQMAIPQHLQSQLPPPPPDPSTMGRPADSVPTDDVQPPAKRAKMDGPAYPEDVWTQMHPNPITVKIHITIIENEVLIAKYPQVAEIGGDNIEFPEMKMNTLISTIKDRISQKLLVPPGKQILSFKGRPTSNNKTLASLNVSEDDVLSLSVKSK